MAENHGDLGSLDHPTSAVVDDGTTHPYTREEIMAAEPAATLTTTEARQGVTLGTMRYVLGISIALAVVGMIAVFIFV